MLKKKDEAFNRSFANLIFQGKVRAALRLLSNREAGSPLHLEETIDTGSSVKQSVRDILVDKHPPGGPINPDCLLDSDPQSTHPVMFDALDDRCIRSVAMRVDGAAGPSGVDAQGWRRLCTSFGAASGDLCRSLAATAKRLCTCFVDPKCISAFLACALSKNPGVRPIGIGETVRRIIAKAITKHDVKEAVGSLQLCAGQVSGIEAGIHTTRHLFENSSTEAALLVDASNAFNCLNRQVALHNVRHICPSMATVLINTYREPSELFMDGSVLLSREGTTQGDPLSMPFYAIATAPLIKRLNHIVPQLWYADDAAGIGILVALRRWWDEICDIGATKTWLIVKEDH